MDANRYKEIVDKHTPNENRLYNGMIAFIIGGLIGIFGEFLVQVYSYFFEISTSEASVLMIITLVFIGCLFTALGFFDKFVAFAKAGLIIPITGFAHSMMSASMEHRKEGLITGIGANMFKLSGTVIIFGIVSAYIVGFLRLIMFGG
ncbi:MAG: SpoVA/SpoVAEb family sporulation membrane protein [Bacilli bacterium]|nr:SpoVA/SpoVAEb family sporulation membrane protein [Bacilli bacterium]